MRVKEDMYSVGGTLAHEMVWMVYGYLVLYLVSDPRSSLSIGKPDKYFY